MASYATVAEFYQYGLPANALGSRTAADVQAALDAASATMDDSFNGRYALPLQSWSFSVRERCCHLAAYLFLSGARGFDPSAGADPNIVARYNAALEWLDKVQRRALHPIVVQAGNVPDLAQPFVSTSSVVDLASGATCTNRGW